MAIHIRRRAFLVGLGGAAACPLAASAQQATRMRRIGVLLFGTPETDPNVGAFLRGMRELGYVESRNIVVEYRYAEGKPDRLRGLAAELVAIKPDLIFALGGDVAPSVRAATSTIPIVIAVSNDPVQAGLVATLHHPGGNITGVTFVSSDLAARRLQFLRDIATDLSRVGVIWNPDHVDPEYREAQTAAKALGIQIHSLEVRQAADFEEAFQTAAKAEIQALMPITSRLMTINRHRIINFSNERRLLLACGFGPWAKEGALLSYGPDTNAMTQRAAAYADKILRGAKPDELPIEQPTKFELVINSKTARSLGVTIPSMLLATADQVIE
ncbi:MAG TPA: ABC transporter substrate-binding protein [Terriglobales bacterium]|nr:ABC transporter substrate-binding protein [Terriglobales bacterium]